MIEDILEYWFGTLDSAGMCTPAQQKRWFNSGQKIDQECRSLFGALVAKAIAGELEGWASSQRGLMALTLLLDQMTRNIYRGTAAAFSGDASARLLVRRAIAEKQHLAMPVMHRVFLTMPLEHSEALADQKQAVALFEELELATGSDQVADFKRFAVAHRDIIAQFGRFPHRNAVLGRVSTLAEIEHMSRHRGF